MKGILYLEDGTQFSGTLFGAKNKAIGEMVFNTSMTGYQEILTDPSYVNQMVVMTYPLVGNYGFNREDVESISPKVNALVVKELCRTPSNFRSKGNLETYLSENGITGIEGVDTRALTLHIREKGSLRGLILSEGDSFDRKDFIQSLPDPVKKVTTKEIVYHGDPNGKKVALLDYGVKASILNHLITMGYYIAQFPAEAGAEEILAFDPRGVVLSNGPGNPEDLTPAIGIINRLMEKKLPMMGICLGHQLISLACGAKTIKLPFGHRGGNHPVKDLDTGKVKITSQNHSYAVDASTLPSFLRITHKNLNDNTIEGLKHLHLPIFSIQYHPEASPGPEDSVSIFNVFQSLLEEDQTCR